MTERPTHVVILKSRLGKFGGLEKHTFRLADGFVQKGCKVTILTTSPCSHNDALPAMEVVPFTTAPWPGFLRMEQFDRKCLQYVEKHLPDVVLGMDRNRFQTHIRAGNGVHAAYLQSRYKVEGNLKKLICQLNPLHQKILQIEKASFESPHLKKLFTNSHMVKEEILHFYQVDPQKIEVIHNGVEWQEMQKDFDAWEKEKPLTLKKLGLNPHHFQLLFIGNGYLRKGLKPLLAALARIKTKNFYLSIIGKENKIKDYQNLTKHYQLDNNVRFFGPQNNTRIFYQFADALVIPSYYDPFANVTIEALAMGLYVISSKTNGGSEIITDTNGCVLFNIENAGAFAEALEKAIEQPKTAPRAQEIRKSVSHLDFSRQLSRLIDATL